jgi:CheY-specific phosphatase CheX
VVLRCSVDSADSIARGLLMMDDSEVLELAAVTDALGECANMLAGSLKTKALDPVGSFQLGLPDFSDPGPGEEMEGALVYRVAQGVMSVEVWLE